MRLKGSSPAADGARMPAGRADSPPAAERAHSDTEQSETPKSSDSSERAPLVRVQNLSFGYDERKVIENISFVIEDSDVIAIIGPNGSGKSTLIKLIIGLLPAPAGSIALSIPRMSIGYVPQYIGNDHTFPATVAEILATDEGSLRAELDLVPILRQKFVKCSIGQQQRVLIALALRHAPRLLILDEPMAGVDLAAKQRFYRLLAHLNSEGVAIVLITHEVNILPPVVRRIIAINKSICCQGPLPQLPHLLEQIYGDYAIYHHDH